MQHVLLPSERQSVMQRKPPWLATHYSVLTNKYISVTCDSWLGLCMQHVLLLAEVQWVMHCST